MHKDQRFISFFGIIIKIILLNSTATCLCLQLSSKSVDLCTETQQECTYTLEGLYLGSGGGGRLYPEKYLC